MTKQLHSILLHQLLLLLLLPLTPKLTAQNISGIINHYTTVHDIQFCESILTVEDATSFSPGDEVLLIQMQGAQVDQNNSPSFGSITSWAGAGLYERSSILAINGNQISLSTWLLHDYEPTAALQLIRIPIYENATITDTLRAKSWDGTTGGVLIFEVTDTLTLNAPIDVSGQGFRGGISITEDDNNCSWLFSQDEYFYDDNNWRGAWKGESIAIMPNTHRAGRGAFANGGGGGNDHNSGGGGGANAGAGGLGGRNDEPATFGCFGDFPGLGGTALAGYPNQRIFMGGGGGAGHSNNGVGSNGGNGGGIAFIHAAQIIGNNQYISANGTGADINQGQDGAGGGGAGGTIYLFAQSLTGNLSLYAHGAKGCDVDNQNSDRCFGPGGGGGGGFVFTNVNASTDLSGGAAGITTNTTASCSGSNLGATEGSLGIAQNIFGWTPQGIQGIAPLSIVQQPSLQALCEGDNIAIDMQAQGYQLAYQWEINDGSGFLPLAEMPPYAGTQSNTLMIDNVSTAMNGYLLRCRILSDCGGELFTNELTINVLATPIANFTFSLNGSDVIFQNLSTGQSTSSWDFGDGSYSMEPNPTHSYSNAGTYIVSLSVENQCGSAIFQDTVHLGSLPIPNFTLDSGTGCAPLTVQFTDQTQGQVNTYNWLFPGGSPATSNNPNPTVVYPNAGTYDVTLSVTNDVGNQSITYVELVHAGQMPMLSFDYQQNGLEVSFINTSSMADNYQWNFGDGSDFSTDENPVHLFPAAGTYPVTLLANNAFCSAAITIDIHLIMMTNAHETSNLSGVWNLYPNPVSEILVLESQMYKGDLDILYYDRVGRLLKNEKITFHGKALLSVRDLPKGIYYLKWYGPGINGHGRFLRDKE